MLKIVHNYNNKKVWLTFKNIEVIIERFLISYLSTYVVLFHLWAWKKVNTNILGPDIIFGLHILRLWAS